MSNIKYVGETALNALVAKIKSITGTITGVMRFVGSLKELPKDNTSYNKGDVILVGTKEYVLNETDGNKVWVEIGDESLWLDRNTIKIEHPHITNVSKKIDLGSIDGRQVGFTVDFSNLVTKDELDSAISSASKKITDNLSMFVVRTELDKFIRKETIIPHNTNNDVFAPNKDNKSISKSVLTIDDKSVLVTIDFNDIYSQIDSIDKTIKDTVVKRDFFEQIFRFNDSNHSINQKYLIEGGRTVTTLIDLSDVYSKIDEIKTKYISKTDINSTLDKHNYLVKCGNGTINLSLKGNTDIAYVNNPESHEVITINTQKFVNDLKAELINTGFVHDDSNTKTTFEEITYEEVENLFK